MATLTDTAYITRKAINLGLILLVLGIVARIILGSVASLRDAFFPPPPPPPTQAFGRLPLPSAQNNIATPSGSISYSLETADGGLPALPPTLRVYFMPKSSSSFAAFDRMKATAAQLGFADVPVRFSATAWRFTDAGNPLRTLDIDEVTQNFRLKYNYLSDQSIFNEKNFSSTDQVVSDARNYFQNLGILPPEFQGGQPIVTFYRFESGALVSTTALANADAVGVTLTRADLDSGSALKKLPVVSPDFRQGLVSVLFSGSNDSKKHVLEARFLVSDVDQENFATYTPISASAAFDKLKGGQAIFASLPDSFGNNVTIRKVYPAYLDPYPAQSFLQPVLVFSDEKGFVAYVPLMAQ
ncbi:hypothetical protein M1403_01740 [Patescibacteria group bacterium]|nr:hypothetical protein [Patescibacteria group bacterium]